MVRQRVVEVKNVQYMWLGIKKKKHVVENKSQYVVNRGKCAVGG